MAHVDDLTFINAAQILGSDNLYLGRPSDTADPDKRTDIDELISRITGPVISLRVNNAGVVANLPGRLVITSTKGPVGQFELHAPMGWVWHSAVGGGGSTAARFVSVEGAGSQTITVHVFSAANNPIDAQFLIQGTLQPA